MLRVVENEGLNRRSFLRAGVLGLGGLTLADVLRLRASEGAPARSDTCVKRLFRSFSISSNNDSG